MRWCGRCGRSIEDEHTSWRLFGRHVMPDALDLAGKGIRFYECPVTLVYDDADGNMRPTSIYERTTELNNRYVHNDRLEEANADAE